MTDNREAIKTHLESRGVPAVGIKAMMANIGVETGYSYDYTTEQKGERTDPARGLFQFDPRGKGLTKPYAAYLEEKGLDDSMESQLDFMVDSITGTYKAGRDYIGAGNAKQVREAFNGGDVVKAVEIFSSKVLRPGKPHLDRRVAEAKKLESLWHQSI